MATDGEEPEGDVEGSAEELIEEGFPDQAEQAADGPFAVEVWNDYDPSMRFVAVFPVGEEQGATAGAVAYYIIEPGKHTGLHSDNAEEIVYVAEGDGEAFVTGSTKKLSAGQFAVLPAGMEHDIYAMGSVELRFLSFFPTPEIVSTFQQTIFPMGGNVLSSKPPKMVEHAPLVQELDPDNLPEDFPFALEELGLSPSAEPREPTPTEIALGLASEPDPDKPPAGEE